MMQKLKVTLGITAVFTVLFFVLTWLTSGYDTEPPISAALVTGAVFGVLAHFFLTPILRRKD